MPIERIQFRLTLGPTDWEDSTSGWRCSALRIPSAEVETIWSAGLIVDSAKYRVERGHQLIRWTERPAPPEVVVGIAVSDKLSTVEDLERAKIRWTFYGVLGSALIAAAATLIVGLYKGSDKSPAHPDITPSAPSATVAQSASTSPVSSASNIPVVPRSTRCMTPPKPDVRLATDAYIVEVAQATGPDVAFHSVNKVAQEAVYKLGDQWNYLRTAPEEKALRPIDGVPRNVYVARWYGLSRGVAEGICCYLDNHDWDGESTSVKKHCVPYPAPASRPIKLAPSASTPDHGPRPSMPQIGAKPLL